MGRVSRWGAAWLAAALAGLVALVVVGGPAHASITRSFAIRYQSQDNGDILLRGNTLLTCPTTVAACPAAITRTATGGDANTLDNNYYAMTYVDTDSDLTTTSSSSALVTLPSGASVKFAGLYWSAYTGGSGRTAPTVGQKNQLRFKAPGDTTYRTITAGPSTPANPVDGTSTGAPYVSFADVTGIVQGAGGGGTYAAADIYAATGTDSYAAWSLVLVIRDPGQPRRDLIVFDGFGAVQASPTADNSLDIGLTGLSTPTSGNVNVQLGAVVFEGDAGKTGDQFSIIAPPPTSTTTALIDPENPANDSFNSTNSDNGVEVTGRIPDGNMFGYDADVFNSTVALGNGNTTATLRMNTGGETYFPAVATFVSDAYAPLLNITRSSALTDADHDGRTRPGDQITYTIVVTNTGNADSVNTQITDAIPAGTTYVPGSLTMGGTPVTTAADSDPGELTGSSLTLRPGPGGTLSPSATTTITYKVQISDAYPGGGTVSGGTTQATYADAANRTFSGSSNTTAATPVDPARADLAVTQVASPTAIQKSGSHAVTWTATVRNNGPETETAPVLVETLPAGSGSITVSGATCTNSGLTYTCPLSTLTSGASTGVTFSATLPANAPDPTSALATVSGVGTDPVSSNNSNTNGIGVNTPPDANPDFAPLTSPATTTDIDVLADDDDPDGDTLSISSVDPPAHGTASIVGGKVRYTLTDPTFVGTESFGYKVCDSRGGCSNSTIDIAVNDHRRAALKVVQTASPSVVQRGGNLTVIWTAIVTNQGPQDDAGPVTLVETLPTGVTGVTVSGAGCSTLTCSLGSLVSGASKTVIYTATLPAGATDPSTATSKVTGTVPDPNPDDNQADTPVAVNRPPTAVVDTPALTADVLSVDIDPTKNDADPDADPLTVTAVTTPAHGTATIVGGKVRYTLTDHTFIGNDTFSYTVCDGRGGCTDSAVTIAVADHDVADLNVAQTAGPKLLQRDGSRVGTWAVTVNNAGPEQNAAPVLTETFPAGTTGITASLAACTVSGVVATCPMAALADGDSARITFTATLPADAKDPASASATVASATGGSPDPDTTDNTATASIALNTPPVADAEAVTLPASALKVTIPVLFGDKDADKDPLTLKSVGKPGHGTAKIVDGKVLYQLTDLDFAGNDTFSYTACDDRSGCDTAQVTVAVANHLHAPAAAADKATVVAGGKVTINVTANDKDQDGGPLTLTKVTGGAVDGTAEVVKGKLVYTPDPGFVGTDSVTYQVCDPTGLCDTATATVKVTAALPIVRPDSAIVRPGGTVVVNVLGNDDFPGGHPAATLAIIKQPSSGTATIGKDGTIHYQAPKSATAGSTVSLRYRVCDTTGACADGTLSLKIAGAPVNGGALAFTGTRYFVPLTMTAMVLLFAGFVLRGEPGRPQAARARHKA
jgi:uncharacterized repeat protein (TIGR01451 family)